MGAHLYILYIYIYIFFFFAGRLSSSFPPLFFFPHCSKDDEKMERNGKWFSGVINFLIVQPAPVSIFIPSYTSYHIYPFVCVCFRFWFDLDFVMMDSGFFSSLSLSAGEWINAFLGSCSDSHPSHKGNTEHPPPPSGEVIISGKLLKQRYYKSTVIVFCFCAI